MTSRYLGATANHTVEHFIDERDEQIFKVHGADGGLIRFDWEEWERIKELVENAHVERKLKKEGRLP